MKKIKALSVNFTKMLISLTIIALAATIAYMIYVFPEYYNQMLAAIVAEITALILFTNSYYSKTVKHYFIFIDEHGRVVDIKTKRVNKSVKRVENVEIAGFIFEINPLNRYHLVPNFGETETELTVLMDKAVAEAKMRERKSTMLDLTVQSLAKLFSSNEILLLLLIISVALSAGNIVLTLILGGG